MSHRSSNRMERNRSRSRSRSRDRKHRGGHSRDRDRRRERDRNKRDHRRDQNGDQDRGRNREKRPIEESRDDNPRVGEKRREEPRQATPSLDVERVQQQVQQGDQPQQTLTDFQQASEPVPSPLSSKRRWLNEEGSSATTKTEDSGLLLVDTTPKQNKWDTLMVKNYINVSQTGRLNSTKTYIDKVYNDKEELAKRIVESVPRDVSYTLSAGRRESAAYDIYSFIDGTLANDIKAAATQEKLSQLMKQMQQEKNGIAYIACLLQLDKKNLSKEQKELQEIYTALYTGTTQERIERYEILKKNSPTTPPLMTL